ncbi:hypothetical protein [Roseomonas chloroacetimidivorans]|jgi:hypothetical protein|uniref:hypothetical protein n=1 Tax=Roseomonas chloroacetimidivorans TaxID=1766656 RepID=UPI003C72C63F
MKGLLGAAFWAAMAVMAPAEAQERRMFRVGPGPRIVTAPLDGSGLILAGPSRMTLADRETIRRWLCPNGGSPVRGRPGRCDGRGSPRGIAGRGGADSEVAGWFDDLPAATHRQLACPEGTKATEARANPGVVRCLPG